MPKWLEAQMKVIRLEGEEVKLSCECIREIGGYVDDVF